ncbi:MAG: plasmid pRiA4b ORF-3 family protein [Saprospiraceae bacterium]|nr:plasmid pRiA4b ORF-3 family protein [Saprospiraceae bacterium]
MMDIVLELDITLLYTRPAIWRRVQVPPRMNLHELHCVVQLAMGWHNCHLYQFIQGNRDEYITLPSEFDWETPTDSRTVLVGDYLADKGEKIAYEYDFGDGWMHEIKVRNVLDADPAQQYPRLVAGERACPPEDCGGTPGFAELLQAMQNPRGGPKKIRANQPKSASSALPSCPARPPVKIRVLRVAILPGSFQAT